METALLAVLVIVFPLWGASSTRRLRANASNIHARTGGYIETLAGLWVTAAIAVALRGFGQLFTAPARPAWLPPAVDLWPVALGLLVGLAVPVVILRVRSGRARASGMLTKQIQNLDWLLPVTAAQRWLWVALSITAGICEEVLFRGFGIRYFMQAPIAFDVLAAALISSLAFGANHGYQGLLGIIATTVMGIVLALLYLATGNLAVPIIVHALIDLRVLVLPRPAYAHE